MFWLGTHAIQGFEIWTLQNFIIALESKMGKLPYWVKYQEASIKDLSAKYYVPSMKQKMKMYSWKIIVLKKIRFLSIWDQPLCNAQVGERPNSRNSPQMLDPLRYYYLPFKPFESNQHE